MCRYFNFPAYIHVEMIYVKWGTEHFYMKNTLLCLDVHGKSRQVFWKHVSWKVQFNFDEIIELTCNKINVDTAL